MRIRNRAFSTANQAHLFRIIDRYCRECGCTIELLFGERSFYDIFDPARFVHIFTVARQVLTEIFHVNPNVRPTDFHRSRGADVIFEIWRHSQLHYHNYGLKTIFFNQNFFLIQYLFNF